MGLFKKKKKDKDKDHDAAERSNDDSEIQEATQRGKATSPKMATGARNDDPLGLTDAAANARASEGSRAAKGVGKKGKVCRCVM